MGDDRRRLRRVRSRSAALAALARISDCLLRRAFGNAYALQTDRKSRAIHHREHAMHAGILFTDQKSGGAAGIAEHHGASRRAMNAELVFDRVRAHVVARPERTV